MKRIKKVFIGLAATLLSLGLAACGGNDDGNKEAIDGVVAQINALPTVAELSLSDSEALSQAIAAFDALSAEDKKSVINSDKLAELEAQLSVLVRIDGVQKLVDAIPAAAELTYASKDAVTAARQAYAALSAAEQAKITGVDKFAAWDEQESWLKKIDRVQQQINGLPTVESMKVTDEVEVLAVENAYNKLTDEEKAKITGAEIISALKEQVAYLQTAKGVQKSIDALPKVESLRVSDATAVEVAKNAYDNLSADEKAAITNADKLEAAVARMEILKKADAAQTKINAIKNTVKDAQKYVDAKAAYEALTDEEKACVDTSKLTAATAYFADMFTAYNTMLGELPAPAEMTEANWDSYYEFKDTCEDLPVEVLDEVAPLMSNSTVADAIEAYLSQFTAYTDEVMLYLDGATNLNISVRFASSDLVKAYINGEETTGITQTENGLAISETAVGEMKYGINKVSFTDTQDKTFKFIVVKGLKAEEVFYYDFDLVGNEYHNSNLSASTNNEIVKEGIDGGSLHVYKSSGGGGWFGLGETDTTGFPVFDFVAGTEYHLSFEFKIDGEKTGSSWWSPMRFGDEGDIGYLYDDASWQLPGNNVLYAQATVEDLGNGVYRFNSIFVPTAKAVNLDFPSWDAKFDMLVDNITLKKVNPDITRIALVGDSITEAANTDTSYPEALQMMLGYDDYFVFNFGKSASTTLVKGENPYRTWAAWQYNYLKKWNPDIIVTMLGTNDGRYTTGIKTYGDKAYIDDYNGLIDEFKGLADKVYLNISPYAFGNEYGIEAAAVNDHIVNVQGYIAYLQNIPVIDVHAATKALDRQGYFPDAIHGNDAGYAEIAKAVKKGLFEGATVYKYHLKYALDCNVAMDKTNCNAALAVYNDPNATQEQIDAAFESIKNEMGTVSLVKWNGSYSVFTADDGTMSIPVSLSGNVISSLKFGDVVLNEDSYTVEEDKIIVKAEAVSTIKKYVHNGEIKIQQGGNMITYNFAAYVGYKAGTILSLNGDATPYTNAVAPEFVAPCEVVNDGIDGKSLHFSPMTNGSGTMLEIAAEPGWGFPAFALKNNTNYKLSFQYKVLEGTANNWMLQIWCGAEEIFAYLYADKGEAGAQATSPIVWEKDEATGVVTFSITFKITNTPHIAFSNHNTSNWLVDNFILEEIAEEDVPTTPPVEEPEETTDWVFDPDVTSYVSDPGMTQYISPCEVIENGIDGKSWQFNRATSENGNAEWLEVGPAVGFGFPKYTFTPGAYYTLSLKYKVIEAESSWGVAMLAGGQTFLSIYADRAEKGAMTFGDIEWTKDETSGVITCKVHFQMPSGAGENGQLHIQNYFFSTVMVDDFRIATYESTPEEPEESTDWVFDPDVTTYVSDPGMTQYISPCEVIENGIDGKSWQFNRATSENGNAEWLEVGPAVGFGFPKYTFTPGAYYTLSLKYKVIEAEPSWGVAMLAGGQTFLSIYADRAEKGAMTVGDIEWTKDETSGVITCKVHFQMPSGAGENGQLHIQNYFFSTVMVDDFRIATYEYTPEEPVNPNVWVFDPDVTSYSTAPGMEPYICPCETIEDGINGKSWKFGHPSNDTGNAEWLEIGPAVGFGFPQRSFTVGATYTLSFDYKIIDAADGWYLSIVGGGQIFASIFADKTGKEDSIASDLTWTKNEETGVYSFSVTFVMPNGGDNTQMTIQNNGFSTVIVDNLTITEVQA